MESNVISLMVLTIIVFVGGFCFLCKVASAQEAKKNANERYWEEHGWN